MSKQTVQVDVSGVPVTVHIDVGAVQCEAGRYSLVCSTTVPVMEVLDFVLTGLANNREHVDGLTTVEEGLSFVETIAELAPVDDETKAEGMALCRALYLEGAES